MFISVRCTCTAKKKKQKTATKSHCSEIWSLSTKSERKTFDISRLNWMKVSCNNRLFCCIILIPLCNLFRFKFLIRIQIHTNSSKQTNEHTQSHAYHRRSTSNKDSSVARLPACDGHYFEFQMKKCWKESPIIFPYCISCQASGELCFMHPQYLSKEEEKSEKEILFKS